MPDSSDKNCEDKVSTVRQELVQLVPKIRSGAIVVQARLNPQLPRMSDDEIISIMQRIMKLCDNLDELREYLR